MGGDLNAFSLWIDENLEEGHSKAVISNNGNQFENLSTSFQVSSMSLKSNSYSNNIMNNSMKEENLTIDGYRGNNVNNNNNTRHEPQMENQEKNTNLSMITTYNSPCLSKISEFRIKTLEVWALVN